MYRYNIIYLENFIYIAIIDSEISISKQHSSVIARLYIDYDDIVRPFKIMTFGEYNQIHMVFLDKSNYPQNKEKLRCGRRVIPIGSYANFSETIRLLEKATCEAKMHVKTNENLDIELNLDI